MLDGASQREPARSVAESCLTGSSAAPAVPRARRQRRRSALRGPRGARRAVPAGHTDQDSSHAALARAARSRHPRHLLRGSRAPRRCRSPRACKVGQPRASVRHRLPGMLTDDRNDTEAGPPTRRYPGRFIHSETWAGSRDWLTIPARSARTASGLTASLSRAISYKVRVGLLQARCPRRLRRRPPRQTARPRRRRGRSSSGPGLTWWRTPSRRGCRRPGSGPGRSPRTPAGTVPGRSARAGRAGIAQVHRDLGVLHLPGGAGVLAGHPGDSRRVLLQVPGLSTTSTAPASFRCSTT
jgi:hypothetical protein